MQKQVKNYLVFIILLAVFIIPSVALAAWWNPFSWGIWNKIFHLQQQTQNPVACTMEAKLCPDGSYVSRQGPKCEFAPCSTAPNANTNNSQPQNKDCTKISYPEFSGLTQKYSVAITPIQVAKTGNNISCGIRIEWKNKPSDSNTCLQIKDIFLKEQDNIKKVPRDLSNFYCGDYTFGNECIGKPSVWACSSSQNLASARGDKTMESIFKEKKCGVAKENGAFFKDTFDCSGMLDYVKSLCLENKNDLKNVWACEALAYNARYVTNQKDEAAKWYEEACKKDSKDIENCNASKGY